MSDLIDRQAAIDFKASHGINEDGVLYVPYGEVKKYLEEVPSAQPEQEDGFTYWAKSVADRYRRQPERTGRWLEECMDYGECSECGFCGLTTDYCPNCGAKMEGET